MTHQTAPGAGAGDRPAPGSPFATPADLAARWRPLTPEEEAKAGVLLGDASAVLRALDDTLDQRLADDTLQPELVRQVACQMVKRAMLAGDTTAGVTQQSQTAGPYASSVTYANPAGDLYATRAERRALGIGGQKAFTVQAGGARPLALDARDAFARDLDWACDP